MIIRYSLEVRSFQSNVRYATLKPVDLDFLVFIAKRIDGNRFFHVVWQGFVKIDSCILRSPLLLLAWSAALTIGNLLQHGTQESYTIVNNYASWHTVHPAKFQVEACYRGNYWIHRLKVSSIKNIHFYIHLQHPFVTIFSISRFKITFIANNLYTSVGCQQLFVSCLTNRISK